MDDDFLLGESESSSMSFCDEVQQWSRCRPCIRFSKGFTKYMELIHALRQGFSMGRKYLLEEGGEG